LPPSNQAAKPWTTPADLRQQVQKRWDRGEILAARITSEPRFPLDLRLKRPGSRELEEDFDAVRGWVRELAAGDREQRGFGYALTWQEHRHRVHGRNALPVGATVPTEADALRLIGKTREAERFARLSEATLAEFPELAEWLAAKPLTALAHAAEWQRVLAVLRHFQANPWPQRYLRQLDIPGVDTKFIEARRRLLMPLLDRVLPDWAVADEHTGVRGFAARYGLLEEPARVRFRILDPELAYSGMRDLTVPFAEFARLAPPVERVFITENLTNGLAFPEHPRALVIFGLGYGLEGLAEAEWLQRVAVHYWGDIDSHGFAILDRLRGALPHARSFLMDRATLEDHRALWTQEAEGQRFTGELGRLTPEEQALFEDLREDRLGEGVRLEQERIAFGHVEAALGNLD
jgi:hypothetical protein